jgi:hypothetical protein
MYCKREFCARDWPKAKSSEGAVNDGPDFAFSLAGIEGTIGGTDGELRLEIRWREDMIWSDRD